MAALVQGNSGSALAATFALAFSSANTAGDTLIAFSPQLYQGSGGTVSDSQGNTWQVSANGVIWYALACKGGANTITFSLSGAGYIEGSIGELSAVSAADQSTSNSGTGTAAASGSVTTTVAGELIIGAIVNGTITPGSGFTQIAANPGGHILEYETQASAGAIAATGTLATSASWYAFITTFKPAGGTPHTANLTDAFTLTDAGLIKNPKKGVAETYSLTDRGIVKSPKKAVSETYTLTDRGLIKNPKKAVSETYTITDRGLVRATQRAVSDALTVSEGLARQVERGLTEAFSLADSLARGFGRVCSDTLIVAEVLTRRTARTFAESFSLSEVFAAAKTKILQFVESFSLSDSLARITGKLLSDNIAPSDNFVRSTARSFTEYFPLADNVARLLSRGFAETFSIFETFRSNAITLTDALRRFVAQIWQRLWSVEPISRTFTAVPVARSWAASGDTMIYADPKDSEAIEDFELDWSTAITPDTIASSSWELPSGLNAAAEANTTTTATVRLSGGTAGAKYLIKNLVVLASGQTKAQTLLIPVC